MLLTRDDGKSTPLITEESQVQKSCRTNMNIPCRYCQGIATAYELVVVYSLLYYRALKTKYQAQD